MRTRGIDVAAELLESLPDPVIGCDTEGTVVFWSRAAEELYGYPAAEALGRRAATLLHTRFPAPLLEITEELSDLGRWQGPLEHRCKDGRVVRVDSRWVARHDRHGARVGSFAVDRAVGDGAAPGGAAPEPAGEPAGAAGEPAGAAGEPAGAAGEPAGAAGEPAGAAGEPVRGADPSMRALAHDLNNALAIIVNYTSFVTAQLDAPQDAPRDVMRADLHEIATAAERALELTRRLVP